VTADSNKSRCEKKHWMWKLKRNIAANEFYKVWKETSLPSKRIFGTVAVTWVIFLWCSKGKRYVNVYLHLYRQQPEMDNQNVDFAYPGKIFAGAHACVICVYNLTSALYFAIWPFCVIRVPFVPASLLACHWMCDSPGTEYARRFTTVYMWHEQMKT